MAYFWNDQTFFAISCVVSTKKDHQQEAQFLQDAMNSIWALVGWETMTRIIQNDGLLLHLVHNILQQSLNYPFGDIQTIQICSDFQAFPLHKYIAWVGDIMTPEYGVEITNSGNKERI